MSQKFSRKLLLIAGAAAVLWLSLRYLLPMLMPLLLAVLFALVSEPLVRFWQKRAKFPRAAATALGISIGLVLLVLIIMGLVALLLRELKALAGVAPDLEQTAVQGMAALEAWLLDLANRAPASIAPYLNDAVENLFSGGSIMTDRVSDWLLAFASGLVTKAPDSLLGIGTWLLASYMFSAKLPAIRLWLRNRIPQNWREQWLPALKRFRKTVTGWILAQCKLMSLTFLVLTVCFFALQISYAPLWALLISLVDALPVLGTGTVLLPWSLVCFLQGDSIRAIGLLGTYAAAWILRSVAEPRLVGKQLGMDPLITLTSMYAGYRLWGIGGMILAPLLTVSVMQAFILPGRAHGAES